MKFIEAFQKYAKPMLHTCLIKFLDNVLEDATVFGYQFN